MLDSNKDKLWRLIGINLNQDSHPHPPPQKEEASRSSKQWSGNCQHTQNKEGTPPSGSLLEQPPFAPPSQPPFAPPSVPHPRSEHWHEEGQLLIAQEESRFEHLVRLEQQEGSIELQNLEEYNQQVNGMPESVTPLVYSKASRREEVRFSKQSAKAIILRIRVAEAKDSVQKVRGDLLRLVERVREEQEWLQSELMGKYFLMQREQSMRVQESVFLHQQDKQQLRYELEVLKNKEQLMRCPLDSELLPSPQLKTQNEELRAEMTKLRDENGRLRKEEESVKRKTVEIEAKTAEVRQSNEKLYEYIFDLEQKVAYYQEEIPKISHRLKEETQKTFQQELEQLTAAHYLEMSRSVQQVDTLQAENARLAQEAKLANELILQLEREAAEIRVKLESTEEEVKTKEKQIQAKCRELAAAENENRRMRGEMQKWAKQREQVEGWRQETRRQSVSGISRGYSSKEDKRAIQALQVEKLVLQKENIQLKATLEFHSKNQLYQPTLPNTYSYEHAPLDHRDKQLQSKEKELMSKERELMSLHNYLQEEGRRLGNKHRDIQSQYILKKGQEGRLREHVAVRVNPIDDYGMKRLPVQHSTQGRRNHFCSSETQVIIDKVKMRQKMKEACVCNDTRNCNCDAHSRASRNSQDSNSRDYLRMLPQRAANLSPSTCNYEWGRRQQKSSKLKQQKSSKMKLIEEKVRRLKSQLKSSFTALNN